MRSSNQVFAGLGTTIFEDISGLALQHDAINLGQGFPDDEGPEELRRRAADIIMRGPNQYPPMKGMPELRQAVAAHNKRFYGLVVDPDREVLVTSGATEALTDSLLALLEPGDEAIVLEPAYDCYDPIIKAAGATPVQVTMRAPDWRLDIEALTAAFSDKTKLLVLNSPMNPTGYVFNERELKAIARLLETYDAYAVCDEVYEHLIFSGYEHIPLMTLPGMRERCIRIGSAGKTFSLTGWKVGYITAAPALIEVIAKAHQFVTFTTPPAFQMAVAWGLGQEDTYFTGLRQELEQRRDLLSDGLRQIGFDVVDSGGTYFLTTDITSLGFEGTDDSFCRQLITQAGVAAIPISAFYGDLKTAPTNFVRFCFCKQESVLEEALERLGHWQRKRQAA